MGSTWPFFRIIVFTQTFYGSPTFGKHSVTSRQALRWYGATAVPTVAPHALHHVQVLGRGVLHDSSSAPGLGDAPISGAAGVGLSFVGERELALLWTVSPLTSDLLFIPDHFFSWASIRETSCRDE